MSKFLAAGLAFIAASLIAAPATAADLPASSGRGAAWTRVFASPGTDWINDVIALRNGGFLAAGYLGRDDRNPDASNWRALAVRLDPNGKEVWRREIDNPGRLDAFWAVVEAPDGELWLSGMTDGFGAGGDAYLVRLRADGTVISQQGIGGPGDDRATDVILAHGGGVVLVGQTDSFGAGERDVLVVRVGADGREVWRKTFGGPGLDRGFYGGAVADGYVAAGVSGVEGDVDVLVLKIDEAGNEVWRRVVGEPGTSDTQHGLAVLPGDRILVTGYTQSWGAEGRDMMAILLSPDGRVLSREAFGGAGDDRVMSVTADAAGGAWAAGYTQSTGAGGWDAFIARIDGQGHFTGAAETFGTAADDHGAAVLPLGEDVLVGGYSASLGEGGQNAFVLRHRPSTGGAPHPNFRRKAPPAAAASPSKSGS